MNLLNAFGGGLWIIPVGLISLSIYSLIRGYMKWKSGSGGYQKVNGLDKWVESEDKVPYFSVGATVFGIILAAAAIGAALWMWSDR